MLRRPRLKRRFQSVANRDRHKSFAWIAAAVEVRPVTIEPVCRDPADDKLLATALGGDAAFIVSEDADLLVLGSHKGIAVVDGAALLALLEG